MGSVETGIVFGLYLEYWLFANAKPCYAYTPCKSNNFLIEYQTEKGQKNQKKNQQQQQQ